MKQTELMIGDWVCVETLPMKVIRLCEHYIDLVTVNGNEIHTVYAEIHPILLTKEILEANGWDVKDDAYSYYYEDGKHLVFYWYEQRLTKIWEGIDEWNNHSFVREISFECGSLTYVHRLQHALRLCGLDELADNFKIK